MGQWHPSLSTKERMNHKAEVVRAWHQIHSTPASRSGVETYYVVELEDLLKKVNSNTTLQISSNIYIMKKLNNYVVHPPFVANHQLGSPLARSL